MGQGPLRCVPGFSSTLSSPLTVRLESHAAAVEAGYRDSNAQLLLSLATLHDAVDASLVDDSAAAAAFLASGIYQLLAANEHLTAAGDALVRLRSDLFSHPEVDPSEPLLAREPLFAALDYDGLYRQLAGEGAALPHRAFWDEVASRMRDGGARAGFRLLERHVRELQTDLRALLADVQATARMPGRALGVALHDSAIPTARVLTGYTRLLTTAGYVSFLCEQAMLAYQASQSDLSPAVAIG